MEENKQDILSLVLRDDRSPKRRNLCPHRPWHRNVQEGPRSVTGGRSNLAGHQLTREEHDIWVIQRTGNLS